MKTKTKKTAKTPPRTARKPVRAQSKPAPKKNGRPQSVALVLGVAESMKQAAELLSWPEGSLKELKRAGAPGFRFSRVYFAELIPWIGQRQIDDGEGDWSQALKKVQTLRERIKLAQDEGRMVDKYEVLEKNARSISTARGELERSLLSELPTVLVGLSAEEIRAKLDATLSRACSTLEAGFTQMAAEKSK